MNIKNVQPNFKNALDYNHPIYEIKQPLPEQGFMEGLNPDEIEAVSEYLRNAVLWDHVNADSERQTIIIWQPHIWACYTEVEQNATMRAHTIKFSDYFKFRHEHRGQNIKKYGI